MSWLDNVLDLPGWTFPSFDAWEGAEPEDPLAVINLDAVVLDLLTEPHIPEPAREFLEAFGQAHDAPSERRGFAHFLDVVWPDGVPATLFVSNVGSDPNAPPHLRNLLLRPTCEGPRGMDPAVGGMTLGLKVYRRAGKLVVKALELTPHVALRDFEARVSAPVVWQDPARFMSTGDFEALGGLAYQRARTEARLADWRTYLKWKEALVHKNRVAIPYEAWRWESETVLSFLIHENARPDRKLVGLELGASERQQVAADDDSDDDRQPQRRPRDPKITDIGEVHAAYRLDPENERDRQVWDGTSFTKKHGCVQFRLDVDDARALRGRSLPPVGQLVSSIAGDLGPIRNQQAGVDRLMRNQGFSPRLADFVFSSTSASAPLEVPDLDEIAESRALNPGQRAAVSKALAAPDLCLVQGPPGTGKTTVISEICLRATRAGQRVLVASQTNLAVDNALGRLGDVPWVRPLRLGDPVRVDEEFRDFLAEYVVERWFGTIAEHCRKRISDAASQEATLAEQERAVAAMRAALADHRRAVHELAGADAEASRAAAERDRARAELGVARQAVEDLSRRSGLLAELRRWAANGAVLPPGCGSESWPAAVALPHGLDAQVPAAVALEQLRTRRRPLQRVQQALERARADASADVDAATELLALRDEKRRLVDSDRDSDLQRLGEVNRRIKALEADGWNQITGELGRAAREAWPQHAPACIDAIVDALRPSDATDAALDEAHGLVAAELELVDAAAEAIGQSAPHWSSEAAALAVDLQAARARCAETEQRLEAAADAAEATSARREAATASVAQARAAWDGAFHMLWPTGDLAPPRQDVMASAERHVADVRAGLSHRVSRARRWRAVQGEWIDRLGRISDSDRDHLQALYIRNSNVVGMTCNEAGKRSTWQAPAFKPFDIVIVDEVSKATPPELILPLLLGRKAVLVGDHRQLPPMFRERDASFGEAAEEGEVSKEDFERFRRMVTASLFQELFEQAPESIKSMLWTQYRMHPQIMDTVNQFYEGRLEAGPDAKTLAAARAHHLDIRDDDGGRLLAPSQHLLWVDTTKAPDGKQVWEEQQGSSKLHRLEVDVVVDLIARLGSQLAGMGYGKTREVRIPHECEGKSWAEALRALVPEVPQTTLDDLFNERRVRVDGRSQRPEGLVRVGVTVELRAQKEVGVITFYGAQLREIRRRIDAASAKHRSVFDTMEIRTNTVDRFQGMEKPIVIASLVRAKRGTMGSFVKEFQRINVGLSRAQQLLVIVGAEDTWKAVQVPLPPIDGGQTIDKPAYQQMIELARRAGGRRLARQVLIR